MMEFVKKYYTEKQNIWYIDYLNSLMKNNKKIITINNSNIEFLHIIYAIYISYSCHNTNILFVSDNPEKIYQIISLFLRNFDENTYTQFISKYSFFNGSEIDILDICVITNNTLKANYVFVEISEFDTKASEYIILSGLQSQIKDFFMICSIKNYSETNFFKPLIEQHENSYLPIIET